MNQTEREMNTMKTNSKKQFLRGTLLAIGLVSLVGSANAVVVNQDVVTVGTVTGSFPTVDVPVYIRDVSGTPLGLDQPSGSRIQSYSIKVTYAPTSLVAGVTFTRAGITTSLTPTFEASPTSAGSISLIDTFSESTNLIPFVLDGAAPGNQIGHLVFSLAPAAAAGGTITLTLDPTLTQLANEGGTANEMPSGNLSLVNGQINLVPPVPAMSHLALLLLATALAAVAIRIRM
jgi:hypothetical protein